MALLVAVLGRRAGIGLGSHDVYANLAGGLQLDDPGLDLPLCLALASSLRDRHGGARPDRHRRGRAAGGAAPGAGPGAKAARGRPARFRDGDRAANRPVPGPPAVKGLEVVAVSNLREAVGTRDPAEREAKAYPRDGKPRSIEGS